MALLSWQQGSVDRNDYSTLNCVQINGKLVSETMLTFVVVLVVAYDYIGVTRI